jgi:hypothetical protein
MSFVVRGRAAFALKLVEKRPTALECRKAGSDRSFSIGPKAFPPSKATLSFLRPVPESSR